MTLSARTYRLQPNEKGHFQGESIITIANCGGKRMNIERTRKIFGAVAVAVLIFAIAVVAAFVYLLVTQPQIVPSGETCGSFWLKNSAILLATLTFASSALAISYNALEQRHLRYMENYPYLVVFPIHTVDPLQIGRASCRERV